MGYETLILERVDNVGIIKPNRPPHWYIIVSGVL